MWNTPLLENFNFQSFSLLLCPYMSLFWLFILVSKVCLFFLCYLSVAEVLFEAHGQQVVGDPRLLRLIRK
jgi:hypothetical protein